MVPDDEGHVVPGARYGYPESRTQYCGSAGDQPGPKKMLLFLIIFQLWVWVRLSLKLQVIQFSGVLCGILLSYIVIVLLPRVPFFV